MKRFALALIAVWLAVSAGLAPAQAQSFRVPAVYAGQADAYPSAAVALDFVGAKCGGQTQCYKAGGVLTSSFASLPGLTVTRASGGYAEDQTGALTWFNSGQARITNKGLLVEEARTNIIWWSRDFTNAIWSKQVVSQTVTANAAVAPDGTTTASLFIPGTSGGNQELQQTPTAAAATYTASAYFKASGYGWGYIFANDGTNRSAWVNLSTAAVGTTTGIVSATATAMPNGWVRLCVTFTTTAALNYVGFGSAAADNTRNYTGNGTSGAYLWGAQLEAGAFPLSYIPTTTASVTRAADQIKLSGLTSTQATIYTDYVYPTVAAGANPFVVGLGTDTANTLQIYDITAGQRFAISVAGSPVAIFALQALSAGNIVRSAAAFSATSLHAVANGITPATTAVPSGFPGALSSLSIGYDLGGSGQLNSYIRRLIVGSGFDADAQLAAFTAGTDLSSINLNFAAGSYRGVVAGNVVQSTSLSGFATAAGYTLTASRGATAYAADSAGNLILFGSNTPRITDRGLLVEEARTNIATGSQTFTTNWAGNTITPNVTLAPDGTLTGGKLIETPAASGVQTQSAFVQVAAAGSTTYSHAIYAKAAERNWLYLRQYDATNNAGAWFNLTTCTVGTTEPGVTAVATLAANGWCRAAITFTSAAGATVNRVQPQIATADGNSATRVGDGVSGFYIWQADLQAGSFMTSPIVTTTAAATRPADSIVLSGIATGLPYTLGGQFVTIAAIAGNVDLLNSGPDLNNLQGFYLPSSTPQGYVYTASAITANVSGGGTAVAGVPFSVTARFNTNAVNVSANGGIGTQDTSSAPVSMTSLNITALAFGGTKLSGLIQQIRIYPYAANDNELSYRSAGNW